MLEQLLIFTRGGLILWKEIINALKGSPIETLIKSCLLEERSAEASFNYDAGGGGGQWRSQEFFLPWASWRRRGFGRGGRRRAWDWRRCSSGRGLALGGEEGVGDGEDLVGAVVEVSESLVSTSRLDRSSRRGLKACSAKRGLRAEAWLTIWRPGSMQDGQRS